MDTISEKTKGIITSFGLEPHVEGGWFRRTFQSDQQLNKNSLTNCFTGTRYVTTSIIYLLPKGEFSAFHSLLQYETWHFYSGDPIIVHWFNDQGILESQILGTNYEKGEIPQLTIKPNTYFAAELAPKSEYAFVGCTVSPGFDYEDFTLAKRKALLQLYPDYAPIIKRLTKK